jgi:hypothetical protein
MMSRIRIAVPLAILVLVATGCARGGDVKAGGPTEDPATPITISEPAEGATVSGTITVAGEARVFEGTVVLRLRDPDGTVALTTFTTATEGAPGRGTWSIDIRMPSGPAGTYTIEAVEESAEDGSDAFVTSRRVQVA